MNDIFMNIINPPPDQPRLLIVDDDRVTRLVLRQEMEQAGYAVVEATNGEEGFAAYQRCAPEVVLLDAVMPVMDGFTCCQLLRQLPAGDRIPILIITSLEDAASVDLAFAAGATDYITKPIHWAVLRQRVLRITQVFRAEAEILRALEQEKALNDMKSRFISMASHEFRNPLCNVLASAELLERFSHKFTEEKRISHLQKIQASVQKMTQLLDEILEISKAEAGKIELNPVSLDLVSFCQNLIEETQAIAGNSYQLSFVTESSNIKTSMDIDLLEKILNNLISNAIKYSPQGGKINLELAFQPEEIIFSIQDEGIGIPEKDLPQLFNTFHRGSNVRNISGTGLGLAIVKNCVNLCGGEITVNSAVGIGSKFTVTLPLYQGFTAMSNPNI
jgi:signal transduction histidine kinase